MHRPAWLGRSLTHCRGALSWFNRAVSQQCPAHLHAAALLLEAPPVSGATSSALCCRSQVHMDTGPAGGTRCQGGGRCASGRAAGAVGRDRVVHVRDGLAARLLLRTLMVKG